MTDERSSAGPGEYALLLLLAFLWGGSFTLIEVALASFPPATIVACRIGLGGLVLLIIALARRETFPRTGRTWAELLVQGTLQGGLPFFLISWGQQHVASSVAGIVNSTPPMFVFLLTVFVLRTAPFDAQKLLGIVLGLGGVTLIATATASGTDDSSVLAVLAVTGASLSYACGAIYGRRFADQSVFVTASTSLLLAAALIAPFAYLLDDPFDLQPALAPTLALLGLALFSTALASLIYFRLIKTLGSLATTSNAYLRALFSILLGIVLLSEPFTWSIAAATVLIFLGVFMVTGQFRRLVTDRLRPREAGNA
ncbi:DMT family transporter [Salinarimonas ramus]|uniref:Permease n=1 Tax=Salinarimonas ramus TaxID=690164 RepID=A0A917Q756_9HYPH|nr:DMT family transporter [Salinarimonas ramus]GGK32524.1 permease [Salinarimonas ramus]